MSKDLAHLLDQGIAYHQAGDLKKAHTHYWEILAEDLNAPDALHLSGLIAYDEGRLHIAKELISNALRFYPHYSIYLNNYALVLQGLKQTEKAIHFYKLALEQDPLYLDAHINLLDALIEEENYREALIFFKSSIKRFPECADLYYLIGSLYIKCIKDDRAIAYLNKTLSIDPTHIKSLASLGDLYQGQGHWKEAAQCYEKCLLQEGLDNDIKSSFYTSIGHCLTCLGDLKTASQCLEMAISLCHTSRKALRNRAKVQHLLNYNPLQQLSLPPEPQSPSEKWDILMASCCTLYELGGGQNPVQIAQSSHRLGHRVLYLQHFSGRDPEEPFSVYDDPFLLQQAPPSPYQRQQLMKVVQGFTQTSQTPNKIVIFSIFTPYLMDFIKDLKALGYKTAYWCLDDWQGVKANSFTSELENQLIHQMDYLFATSRPLAQKLNNISGKPCTVISNGFNPQQFSVLNDPPPIPKDMRLGTEKTFIYWGNLSASWIHWQLLEEVANRNPKWAFNLIGELKEETKKAKSPNIHYLGLKQVHELYPYGHYADIGFIHFKENKLIEAVNPVKAYEYLACHLPIISTPMPELNVFPYTYQVRTAEEFEAAVAQIEQTPLDAEILENFIQQSTWEHRVQEFLSVLHSKAT